MVVWKLFWKVQTVRILACLDQPRYVLSNYRPAATIGSFCIQTRRKKEQQSQQKIHHKFIHPFIRASLQSHLAEKQLDPTHQSEPRPPHKEAAAMANTVAAGGKPPKKAASPAKTAYLVLYNFASAIAWSVVLGRVLAVNAVRGSAFVHIVAGDWTKWTQTMAGMEVLHSLFGIVRAPLFTTLMQVASRFLLVWGIVHPFPYLAQSPVYSSMLFAWSVTEVIRYSYFALTLSGWQPAALTWLRYNTFFVLYPIGILSECFLVWKAAGPLAQFHELAPWISYAILAVYVPGKVHPQTPVLL
jgi:very-long-chain (3R)-3-hydroxyacyl-CoA dehydratase